MARPEDEVLQVTENGTGYGLAIERHLTKAKEARGAKREGEATAHDDIALIETRRMLDFFRDRTAVRHKSLAHGKRKKGAQDEPN